MEEKICSWIKEDSENILSLLKKLVMFTSREDIEDTRGVMGVLCEALGEWELPYDEYTHTAKRPNILANFSGLQSKTGGDTGGVSLPPKHLMLCGHLDILPTGNLANWSRDPFAAEEENGRIYGRGLADMKAGVVAMLYAYRYANRCRSLFKGQLSMALVSDEETGWGRGAGYLFDTVPEKMLADGVLLAEPTHEQVISYSSKGYTQLEITVSTQGAIAGYDNFSENAVEVAMDIACELKKLEEIPTILPEAVRRPVASPEEASWYEARVGRGMVDQLQKISVTVGKISGGDLPSLIPSQARLSVMIVTPQGVSTKNVVARARRIVKKFPGARLELVGSDAADYSEPRGELFENLAATIARVTGKEVRGAPEIALSDARYWRYRGIPAYWYGCDGSSVGMPDESVEFSRVLELVEVYTRTIISYLK